MYHVLSRGNERHDIVISDTDRKLFLDTVLSRAAGVLKCDMNLFRESARISQTDNNDRDLRFILPGSWEWQQIDKFANGLD